MTLDALEQHLDHLLQGAATESLAQAMRYAVLGGGKRFRAQLCLATAQMLDVPPSQAIQVACAIELAHAYSLVHDDLPAMDDDDLRRGKPTVHKAFDEATAILVGDALQALAFEVLASPQTHVDAEVRCALVTSFAKALGAQGMVGGQAMDMVGHDDVLRLQRLKTGALIAFAVQAPAMMAGVDQTQRNALSLYADHVGLAFQITDDLLDLTGDQAEVGKRLRKDENQGKNTLIAPFGAEKAGQKAHDLIQDAINAVTVFGDAATPLCELARFCLKRRG